MVKLCMYNLNTEWAEWLWVNETFMLCVLGAKKTRVLGNEKCGLCFNWIIGIISGLYYVNMFGCMIFHLLA